MSSVAVSAGIQKKEVLHQTRWKEENTYCVGVSLHANFCREAQLLDPHKYTSVIEAVTALNNGSLDCPSYCLVLSKRRNAYYLLWPSEKTEREVRDFTAGLQNSSTSLLVLEQKEVNGFALNGARLSKHHSSSSVFSVSTIDTPPVPAGLRVIPPEQVMAKIVSKPPLSPRWAVSKPVVNPRQDKSVMSRETSPDAKAPSKDIDSAQNPRETRSSTNDGLPKSTIVSPESRIDSKPSLRPLSPRRVVSKPLVSPRQTQSVISLEKVPPSKNVDAAETPCETHSSRDVGLRKSRIASPEPSIVSKPSLSVSKKPLLSARKSLSAQRHRESSPTLTARAQTPRESRRVSPERTASRRVSPERITVGKVHVAAREAASFDIGSNQPCGDRNVRYRQVRVVKLAAKEGAAQAPVSHTQTRQNDSTAIEAEMEGANASHSSVQGERNHLPASDINRISVLDATTMAIEEFQMIDNNFNPNEPQLKVQLLENLGFPDSAEIEQLHDNSGAFNDGVWIVSGGLSSGLVLKLVPHQQTTRKTDQEKYTSIQQQCPKILSEYSVAFPLKILQLIGPDGDRYKDLLVMRQAPGLQLTQHLYHKFNGGLITDLLNMFEEFGRFLKTMHQVYRVENRSMQHGDCQPSNVFYDEVSAGFTLIDVADFGFGPYLAQGGEDDVEHFVEGLSSLQAWYGQSLIDDCIDKFREGYGVKPKVR
mmetsp:Transcript_104298/g.162577  ORF Transcript_104298/g.162577 Transcript_104298/m.162577 type:complete len:705 (+) Transcript_104298:49-2163(+)